MHAWCALWPWNWTKDKRAPDRLIHWLRTLVDGGVLTKEAHLRAQPAAAMDAGQVPHSFRAAVQAAKALGQACYVTQDVAD